MNRSLHCGRTTVPFLVVAMVALSSCLPSPPPSIPQPPSPPPAPAAPTTTAPKPKPTTTVAPTTTVPAPEVCGSGPSSLSVQRPVALESIDEPITELIAEPIDEAALELAALEADGDPVAITAVDSAGRPTVHQVTAEDPAELQDELLEVTGSLADAGHRVVAVETDQPVAAFGAPDPHRVVQWPLDRLPYESLWSTADGTGVCVAVLDNGIQRDHPDLAGAVVGGTNQTDEALGTGADHATHVAGVIAATPSNGLGVSGAAPGVSLLDVKVLRAATGTGYDSWVAAGIAWAVDHGAQVVNLSLGSRCAPATPCASAAMSVALDYAESNGVLVVAAAGNDGDPDDPPENPKHNWWSWPAAFEWPVAVASTRIGDLRSPSSTQAPYIDVAAPGDLVASTIAESSYAYMTGTSMATPYVSALAAILWSARPHETASDIRTRITSNVEDIGAPGWDVEFGQGLIDPGAAMD